MIPVIVEGPGPTTSRPRCAMRCRQTARSPTGRDHPRADMRESGDGKTLRLAKAAAGLIGVPSDDIVRRAERAKWRRTRIWGAHAGVFLLLAVGAAGSAVYAWQQLKTNEAFLDATLERFTGLVERAVSLSKTTPCRYRDARLPQRGRGHVRSDGALRPPDPEARLPQSRRCCSHSPTPIGPRADCGLGEQDCGSPAADVRTREADPGNVDWIFELGGSTTHRALLLAKGNLAGALAEYRARQQIVERLAKADPSNDPWQRDLAVS